MVQIIPDIFSVVAGQSVARRCGRSPARTLLKCKHGSPRRRRRAAFRVLTAAGAMQRFPKSLPLHHRIAALIGHLPPCALHRPTMRRCKAFHPPVPVSVHPRPTRLARTPQSPVCSASQHRVSSTGRSPATAPATLPDASTIENTTPRRTTATTGTASPVGSNATASAASRVKYPGLRASRFQHPIDIRATRTLRAVPFLEPAARAALSAAEAALGLELIASSVRVTPTQLPSLHASLVQACHVLDMAAPELYIKQSPVPNAYTLAVRGRQPFIVVHSALLELLDDAEVQAVLAHECGHLKAEHGLWVSMANVLVLASSSVLGPSIGDVLAEVGHAMILRWLRAAELTCDRAALLVVQDPDVVMSALMKLAGGSPKYAGKMNVQAYLEQAAKWDEAAQSGFGRLLSKGMMQTVTHPLPILRVRELKRWSDSNHFRTLMSGGEPL